MTTRSITGAGVPYPSNHTLAYDAANRLISATPQPSGSATTYGYDGHDRRVAATPPGGVTKLTMYSKAGQLLSEIRTNGSARVNYVYLGRHLLARVPYNSFGTGGGGLGSAPPKLFQHTDGLGTPIAVTDASGVLQGQRSVYEAYGDKVGVAEADGPGYTGHVADALTGLTYMQARFYDPVAGRFLSIDPVAADIGNFNRYWYANNNPYKFVDPDGRQSVDDRKKLDGCMNCVLTKAGNQWIAVPASIVGDVILANAAGVSVSEYNSPPTRAEVASTLDKVSVAALAVAVTTSTDFPPLAVAAGIVDVAAATMAFALEPTVDRAAGMFTAGVTTALKQTAKAAEGTAALAVEALEKAQQADRNRKRNRDARRKTAND